MSTAENRDEQPADGEIAAKLRAATELLETVARDRGLLGTLTVEERTRLLTAAADVFNPDVVQRRRFTKAKRKEERDASIRADESMLADTGIRVLRDRPVFTTPNVYPPKGFEPEDIDGPDGQPSPSKRTNEEQHCYVCKQAYRELHPFYDQLCPPCAEFNFAKRTETADLRGRVALLTGGRVKIGYQAGIKLLRAGCHLIVTTRFPRDSAARYAHEADFADWGHRLEIFGLDLRHTPSVEAFCRHLLATRDRLDFIVNNACQTVRRPPDFYRHMMEGEKAALQQLPESAQRLLGAYEGLRGYNLLPGGEPALMERMASTASGLTHAAELSQAALLPEDLADPSHLFPQGQLDQDRQQVDLRDRNSWRLLLAEVSSVELLETQLVNAIAPFVLNARLKPLMLRSPERDKH